MSYLNLYHLDPTSPTMRSEIEGILGAEGIRAPIIDWFLSSFKTIAEERDQALDRAEEADSLRSEIEELESEAQDLEDEVRKLNRRILLLT